MADTNKELKSEPKKRRPKGDGSVQKLSKDKYKVQITVGYDAEGKQQRKSFTATTKRAVVEMLNTFKAQAQQGILAAPSVVTLEAYAKRWLEIKKNSVKPKSYVGYESSCNVHIIPDLGKHKMQKLTTVHINNYLTSKLNLGYSSSMLLSHKSALHNIFDLALSEGIVPRNIVKGSQRIKDDSKEVNTLSEEQSNALLGAAKERWLRRAGFPQMYHMILLALNTGMRRGEMLGLKWDNVDVDKGTIKVIDNLVEVKGKGVLGTPKVKNSLRTFKVGGKVLKVLKDELWTEGSTFVFNVGFDSLKWAFDKCCKDAKLPESTRLHDIRHTHITHLLSNGYDVKLVAVRVGDDPKTIMSTYAHVFPERDKDAAEFIETMFSPSA